MTTTTPATVLDLYASLDPAERLPKRLWRIVWLEGIGWPDVHDVRVRRRDFDAYSDLEQQVANILRWPTHHRIIGVWTTACEWVPVTDGDDDNQGGNT